MGFRVAVSRSANARPEQVGPYFERAHEAGLETIDVCTLPPATDAWDALLLTGGSDIDPRFYGEEPHPEVTRVNTGRDELELELLGEALRRDRPVLAICRGHQLLNVALGGSLLQHIESGEHEDGDDGLSRWHPVRLDAASRAAALYGSTAMLVNSRHHQALTPARLAKPLVATGWTPDGLVEAVESAEHTWVIGVQWHPERPEPQHPGFREQSGRLFRAFALALGVG